MITREQIYDEICRTLTDYENADHNDSDSLDCLEWIDTLYCLLVKVQNNWETVITSEN